MDDRPIPTSEVEDLRRERATLEREVERLRQELAETRRTSTRRYEAHAAETLSHAGQLAASATRTAIAETDAHAAWTRAAELGTSLGRRIAEGQARLIASQTAVASLEHANQGLAAGRAAIALREADLRAVIESAIDCAIVTTDRDGLVLAWNSGARRLLGWDEATALVMDLDAALPPEDRARGALAADMAAALSGVQVAREGWLLRLDGTSLWAGIEAIALRVDGEAEPVGVLWMLRDRSAARLVEERLRRVLDTDAVGVLFFDGDGTLTGANDAFLRMSGYTRDDVASGTLTWRRMTAPEWVAESQRQMAVCATTGRIGPYEKEYLLKDGSRRWMLFAGRDLGDGTMVEFCLDVTERRRAEEALRESEARLGGFAENSADVLWIADATGARLLYLSPAFETMFGAARGDALADIGTIRALVHPEDRAAFDAAMPRTLSGETVRVDYRVQRPTDGCLVHVQDTGFPVRGPDGALRQVAGIVRDVTEQRRVEQSLAERERHLRALVEGVPHLVWRAAAGGQWHWASPQWTGYTGLSEEASRGSGWLEAVHPDDRAGVIAAWAATGEAGVLQADHRLRRAGDGAWRWFRTRGIPLQVAAAQDPDGQTEWLGTSTDMDEQIRAQEALRKGADLLEARVAERTAELMAAEETLRQAQKLEAIGQLTGGIAHDFNNMLQGVAGGLDMAKRRMKAGRLEEAAGYLDVARDATGRAAGLTRRLLAFARRQRLEPRAVDPDVLVRGMADMLRRTLGPAIALELRLEEGCGFVTCDPHELESALLNLCINARDAMPGGGRLVVATRDRTLSAADLGGSFEAVPGEFVEMAVTDTGSGIPPEVLERVLEPFFTTKPLGQGTGLGLSQIYGFVRQSGGALRIESSSGHGTTVCLWLPFSARRKDAGEVPGEAVAPEQDGDGATILLVDDETGVREPAAARLRDLGYVVVEAPDGPGALRLLDEGLRPDLLVTDIGLPGGMDGARVAEAVQRRRPGLPVLFMTGYATAALPFDARVIAKPFTLDTLTAHVRNCIADTLAGGG